MMLFYFGYLFTGSRKQFDSPADNERIKYVSSFTNGSTAKKLDRRMRDLCAQQEHLYEINDRESEALFSNAFISSTVGAKDVLRTAMDGGGKRTHNDIEQGIVF